jgi:iron(III) transport system substrate-binding protein
MRRALVACVVASALLGCQRPTNEVVVYTSVDQPFAQPVFDAFASETGIHVRAVYDTEETKSTGVLNRLLAEAGNPQADVFFSGDPVRPQVLIARGLVDPYAPPASSDVPDQFKDPQGAWTGGAARARVLLVNRNLVSTGHEPQSLSALTEPRWKGRVAIANPVFGTTTMHMAALFAVWGEARFRAFLDALKGNDVRVASSNGEVKRLVAAGEVAFGLTDTDDANEALKDGAAVLVVYPDQDGDGTLVMPTAVTLLRGPHREAGRRLVDFLVGPEVERMLAESAAHMPLRADVSAPPGIRRVTEIRAMKIDYAELGAVMQRIEPELRAWAGL